MNKNRIEGAAEQGERAKSREALVTKARRRRCGGCAMKECALTWVAPGGQVKRAVATRPLATFKQRIRQKTRRSGGRGMEQVIDELRPYLLGWKAYFGLSQTPRVWRGLDEWVRHRLRAIQLKQWKRGTTMFRELRALGASHDVARQIAANSRSWWRNSGKLLNSVLTLAWFDRLGLPRLS
jgi:RNA-directed DNA polymerase